MCRYALVYPIKSTILFRNFDSEFFSTSPEIPLCVWVNNFVLAHSSNSLVLQQNMGQCVVFLPWNHCGLQALVFMHLNMIKKTHTKIKISNENWINSPCVYRLSDISSLQHVRSSIRGRWLCLNTLNSMWVLYCTMTDIRCWTRFDQKRCTLKSCCINVTGSKRYK